MLAFQFALGLADVLLLAPVWMQIAHLLGADLYWVALVMLAAAVIWPISGERLSIQPDHRASNPQISFPRFED
jgi:cytochrome c oxidase assembly protein subunit 15